MHSTDLALLMWPLIHMDLVSLRNEFATSTEWDHTVHTNIVFWKNENQKRNFFFQISFKECCLAKNFKKCIIFVKVSHMRTLFSRKYRFFPKPEEIFGMNLYSDFQLDYSMSLIWDFQILLINQSRTNFCIKRFRLKDFYKILVYIFCSCLR